MSETPLTYPTVDWIIDVFNAYPMLWSLYGIAVVVPFVLLAACCCTPKTTAGQQGSKREDEEPNEPVSTARQDNSKGAAGSEGGARYRKRKSGKQTATAETGNGIRRGSETTDDSGPEETLREETLREEEELGWNFPPTLDDFNLMECEEDPARLEEIFTDRRLVEVRVMLSHTQGLGLTIVGGKGSQNGDIPIYLKRILPTSVLEKDGILKSGDELVAVNEILLVNATKEFASNVLCNAQGRVRLLALQDL